MVIAISSVNLGRLQSAQKARHSGSGEFWHLWEVGWEILLSRYLTTFHYDDAYYHAAIQQLTVAFASSLHTGEGSATQLPRVAPLALSGKPSAKL
jgi:hypothetical protein